MGADFSTKWFDAAYSNNVKILQELKMYNIIEESSSSSRHGFGAIHYASYFGNKQAVEFLETKEASLLTKYPVWLALNTRDNKKVLFPEGLSYQCILALQGKSQLLIDSILRIGVIRSEIPLFCCLIIGNQYHIMRDFNQRIFANVVKNSSIYSNPLLVAAILGHIQYINFITDSIKKDSYGNSTWMLKNASKNLQQYYNKLAFKGLQNISGITLAIENAKDQIKFTISKLVYRDILMGNKIMGLRLDEFCIKTTNGMMTPCNSIDQLQK
ncbi:hypothetical protein SS50377_28035 [Spironucleus salmonicida]|uniref:Ankyrin repeat-containing protein n=1 Tax=Spironucleus salmonicida TaxID=348837 RepID=V6LPD8_9EUKA|nr:hypothetical protein SS50377_28035 [Spironucleus salmonicida]|eukprot:EST42589.1 Hypothetical protein SS50377_17908 [Spironucleus salmonicida]